MVKYAAITNVIFELYKVSACGEITVSDFIKAKEIVKRAKLYDLEELEKMDAQAAAAASK